MDLAEEGRSPSPKSKLNLDDEPRLCVAGGDNSSTGDTNLTIISSAEQYFKRGVLKEDADLKKSLGVPDLELAICLAGCWVLLFFTMWKGVASSGKVAYFTAIFPYVVLITLLVRGLTLPGAMEGVMFYITPKWSELLNLKVKILENKMKILVRFGTPP